MAFSEKSELLHAVLEFVIQDFGPFDRHGGPLGRVLFGLDVTQVLGVEGLLYRGPNFVEGVSGDAVLFLAL